MDRSAPSELLVRQRLRALEKNLPAAARGSVEALHQARVASRRLREALPLVSHDARGRGLEREMRRITQALGPVRDLDVALQLLDEMERSGAASPPAATRLRQAVTRERQLLQADMQRRLARCDLETLKKRALGAARRSAGERGRRRDPHRLGRAIARAARRAERLRTSIESAGGLYLPDRLHDVRIGVKKLRYAIELVRELGGGRLLRDRHGAAGAPRALAAKLRRLKSTQDLLGRMRDLEVLIARTRGVQGAPGAPNLKVSGELDRLVRRFETECRRLHGRYMSSRQALIAICDAAAAAAKDASAAHAA